MISKLLYGAGYVGTFTSIKVKTVKNLIVSSNIISKQKQFLASGSEAAQFNFVVNRIRKEVNGDIDKLQEAINKLKQKTNYLGISKDIFRNARLKVIEEQARSVDLLMDNVAPQMG